MAEELVGTYEIEQEHQVPRYKVRRLLKRKLWPEPVAHLHCGMIFRRESVRRAVERLKQQNHL